MADILSDHSNNTLFVNVWARASYVHKLGISQILFFIIGTSKYSLALSVQCSPGIKITAQSLIGCINWLNSIHVFVNDIAIWQVTCKQYLSKLQYILKSTKVLEYFWIQNIERDKRNALSLNFKMQLLEVDKGECS